MFQWGADHGSHHQPAAAVANPSTTDSNPTVMSSLTSEEQRAVLASTANASLQHHSTESSTDVRRLPTAFRATSVAGSVYSDYHSGQRGGHNVGHPSVNAANAPTDRASTAGLIPELVGGGGGGVAIDVSDDPDMPPTEPLGSLPFRRSLAAADDHDSATAQQFDPSMITDLMYAALGITAFAGTLWYAASQLTSPIQFIVASTDAFVRRSTGVPSKLLASFVKDGNGNGQRPAATVVYASMFEVVRCGWWRYPLARATLLAFGPLAAQRYVAATLSQVRHSCAVWYAAVRQQRFRWWSRRSDAPLSFSERAARQRCLLLMALSSATAGASVAMGLVLVGLAGRIATSVPPQMRLDMLTHFVATHGHPEITHGSPAGPYGLLAHAALLIPSVFPDVSIAVMLHGYHAGMAVAATLRRLRSRTVALAKEAFET